MSCTLGVMQGSHGVLGVGIERELGVAELAGSTGSEAVAFYKLGEAPLLDAGGNCNRLLFRQKA